MCDNKQSSITNLIEQRIQDDVERSEMSALEPLRHAIEVELKKLGINSTFTSMHTFVSDMRRTHIKNQVRARVNALVDRVVDHNRHSPAFQVGDKVMLNSGGPAMTVVVALENGGLMCEWVNGAGINRSPFLPVCLTRVAQQ